MPFVHEIPVRWGELDPYNHLNHAVYFSYCEAARIAMLEQAGWGMGTLEDAGFIDGSTCLVGAQIWPAYAAAWNGPSPDLGSRTVMAQGIQ